MELHILNTRYGVDDENLFPLSEDAKDYAMFKGIEMRTKDLSSDARVPVSFCLFPSPFPKRFFQIASELQPDLNKILLKVSYDKEFLKDCLTSIIETDEFTRKIHNIYEATFNSEQLSLGLIRSDYLLNMEPSGKITGIKQVENNVIATSFGGLAPILRDLHGFVLGRLGQKGLDQKLPQNKSVSLLAKGIISAWDAYKNISAIVLFVVEDVTYNISDQRALEYAILEDKDQLEVLRCTFKELRNTAVLKGNTLFVKDKEVAVVYYRTGYMPEQYENEEDWEVRLLMEKSKAIKCPSAGLHLAATKRVQACLNQPGILERFVSKESANKVRDLFVEQNSLDEGKEGDKAISLGVQNPEKYVLKPEREGGGNNLYGNDLKKCLESIQNTKKRQNFILMELINSPKIPNCIIRRDRKPEVTHVICELGIYGTILGCKEKVYQNSLAGHLLRSRQEDESEVGIVAGFGALDSPYLE